MWLFRLIFLAVTLAATLLYASAQFAPDVYQNMEESSLIERAQAESAAIGAREAELDRTRIHAALLVASHPDLLLSLQPPPPPPPPPEIGPDGLPVAPTQPAPTVEPPPTTNEAFTSALTRLQSSEANTDAVVWYSASGAVLESASTFDAMPLQNWAQSIGIERALTTLRPVTRLFVDNGTIYASAVVPVLEADGSADTALAIIEEYDAATLADRTGLVPGSVIFFNEHVLAVSALSSEAAESAVTSTLLALDEATLRGPGESADWQPTQASGQTILVAPFRLNHTTPDAPPIGAAIVLEIPPTPDNLVSIIVENGGFDDTQGAVWATIVGGVFLFLLGLLLVDFSQARAARKVADRIVANTTSNTPEPIKVATIPGYMKVVANAYNDYMQSSKRVKSTRAADAEDAVAQPEDVAAPEADVGETDEHAEAKARFDALEDVIEERINTGTLPEDAEVILGIDKDAPPGTKPVSIQEAADDEIGDDWSAVSTQVGESLGINADELPVLDAPGAGVMRKKPAASAVGAADHDLPAPVGSADPLAQMAAELNESTGDLPASVGSVDPFKALQGLNSDEFPSAADHGVPEPAAPALTEPEDAGLDLPASVRSGSLPLDEDLDEAFNMLASGSFDAVPEDPAPEPEPWADLYAEFIETKQQCGERTDTLDYARFAERVERNKAAIIKQYGCSDVRFEVQIKKGKAALKAVPVR